MPHSSVSKGRAVVPGSPGTEPHNRALQPCLTAVTYSRTFQSCLTAVLRRCASKLCLADLQPCCTAFHARLASVPYTRAVQSRLPVFLCSRALQLCFTTVPNLGVTFAQSWRGPPCNLDAQPPNFARNFLGNFLGNFVGHFLGNLFCKFWHNLGVGPHVIWTPNPRFRRGAVGER